MKVYLSAAPQDCIDKRVPRCGQAHVAYRIGDENRLLGQLLPPSVQGGLLSLSDAQASTVGKPQILLQQILQECNYRNYHGVLLDFEEPLTEDRLIFVRMLGSALTQGNRLLYMPQSYSDVVPNGIPLICTAISGGEYASYLRSAIAACKRRTVALDLQRIRMDFILPAKSGLGRALSLEEFRNTLENAHTPIFFSKELCAKYFTYPEGDQTHFVLFDDESTLSEKLRIGEILGCQAAFLMYPEVRDLLPSLKILGA